MPFPKEKCRSSNLELIQKCASLTTQLQKALEPSVELTVLSDELRKLQVEYARNLHKVTLDSQAKQDAITKKKDQAEMECEQTKNELVFYLFLYLS